MREEILTFGENGEIVGIRTQGEQASEIAPSSSTSAFSNKPMVLLSHAGLLHRVGPYRQWVDLARLLSNDGFSVFRFDFNGLRDGDMSNDSISDTTQPINDFVNVMNYLEKNHGAKHFIIIGLCSGADIGYFVTVADKRVVGIILMEGFGYRTMGWYVRHYLPLDVRKWKNRFRSLFRRLRKHLKASCVSISNQAFLDLANNQDLRNFPSQEQAQTEIQQLVDRGVDMLFIYSSGAAEYLNYANQFHAMLPKLELNDKIQVQFYPEADHMFTLLEHRAKLHESIRRWMQRF